MAKSIYGHTIYVVEGPTDASFIARLACRLWYPEEQFSPELFKESGHQTLVIEGKENLSKFLKSLPKFTGFVHVRRVVIMLDADESLIDTLSSIGGLSDRYLGTNFGNLISENTPSSDRAGREIIPWVAPFVHMSGDLERVLWDAVKSDAHKSCVESFLDCVTSIDNTPITSRWKALVDSYLVTQNPPTYKVSHWFQQEQFPWDHASFDEIKGRLWNLRNGV